MWNTQEATEKQKKKTINAAIKFSSSWQTDEHSESKYSEDASCNQDTHSRSALIKS